MAKITFKSIGKIYTGFKDPREAHSICRDGIEADNPAKIIIDKKYLTALEGLDNFSHMFVLYHLSKVDDLKLKTYPGPPQIKGLPEVGLFATRAQYRPNPIAMRLTKLDKIKSNTIFVKGMDAIDGSPVLDIKPYVSGFDRPKKFEEASWYRWDNNE